MSSSLFKFDFNKRPPVDSGAAGQVAVAPVGFRTTETSSISKQDMSQEVFNKYRSLIYKLCGIFFTDSKKYLLEGRVAKRLAVLKFRTFVEYLNYIESAQGKDELNELFEAITINETYFFRSPQQFDAFETKIIPEIIQNQQHIPNLTIKVWVAASSTGEEAYTIAILLLEKIIPKYPNVKFQIFASDIDRIVIEQAKKGMYKEYAIRNVPKDVLAKYFRFNGSLYVLSDQVKNMVRFSNINLYNAAQMRQMRGIDVIFCCNVLIYFDLSSKQQVVSHIFDSLNRGGYLFIGYSESLHGISKAFKLVHHSKSMVYKKE